MLSAATIQSGLAPSTSGPYRAVVPGSDVRADENGLTFTNAASCPVVQGREISSGAKVSTRGMKVEKEKKRLGSVKVSEAVRLNVDRNPRLAGEAKMEALRASAGGGDSSTKYEGKLATGGDLAKEGKAGKERERMTQSTR